MAAQLAKKDRPRAYLDFDVDDACARFKRASHFVESKHIAGHMRTQFKMRGRGT